MQDNTNQTNQKDPDNRGLNGEQGISESIRSIWCGREDLNLHSLAATTTSK